MTETWYCHTPDCGERFTTEKRIESVSACGRCAKRDWHKFPPIRERKLGHYDWSEVGGYATNRRALQRRSLVSRPTLEVPDAEWWAALSVIAKAREMAKRYEDVALGAYDGHAAREAGKELVDALADFDKVCEHIPTARFNAQKKQTDDR